MLDNLAELKDRKTGRFSSWDRTGRNADSWQIKPGETRVLADIRGPARITHIWMTQAQHYREVLLKITWDNAKEPSVLCPLGDFFCLGHGMVTSFQSLLFSASSNLNLADLTDRTVTPPLGGGCALNCYVSMPFKKRAVVELVNESNEAHGQYFYIDYETLEKSPSADTGYFHAEFRRTNPFGGWGHHLRVNTPRTDIVNTGDLAWKNNYVILEAKGRGHYLGCNLSVTNFNGGWWGEGDDMMWVDGKKWPPDLHGTGSEDYLNQAWGMQPNAFLRNGSSIFEKHTGGYQTSYVFHLENPVRFKRDIKVTIEHGHGNHLANEMSSVAYWYAAKPAAAVAVPPVKKRLPVLKGPDGTWIMDPVRQCPGRPVTRTAEIEHMLSLKGPVGTTLKIDRLKKTPALSGIGTTLARCKPIAVGGKPQLGEVRLAVAGNNLVLLAQAFDKKPVPSPGAWLRGAVFELYGAAAAKAPISQFAFLPAIGGADGKLLMFKTGEFWPGTPPVNEVQWRTTKVKGGYAIAALVPLRLLGAKPGARSFCVDMSFGVCADTTGKPRRAGTHGWPVEYDSAATYHTVKIG